MRGWVARVASARTGHPIRIDGSLDVHLFSLTPHITVTGLKVGNPRWAGPGLMADVGRMDADVRLLPVLVGNLVIPRLRIEQAAFNLVRGADGRVNWSTARAPDPNRSAPSFPLIQRLEMPGARLTYADVRRHEQFEGTAAASEEAADTASRPFRLVGVGTMNGEPFRFDVRGAALSSARPDKPYPFDANVLSGTTHVVAHGAIAKPFDLGVVAADVTSKGEDMAGLYEITGIALPNTPAYEISGHVSRHGTRIDFEKVSGTVGDSDVSGEFSVELKGERPFVQAQLSSRSLDLDDVVTWFGARPVRKASGDAPAAPASPARKARDGKIATNHQLFPDAQLQVDRVRAMNAQVKYSAAEVRSGRFPIHSGTLDVKLENGILTLDPVSLKLEQGKIRGSLKLDAREDIAKSDLDARISGMQLAQFKRKNGGGPLFDGAVQGRILLQGSGNSVHRFFSSSNGTVTFVVPHGEIRDTVAELAGVTLSRGLGLLFTRDQGKVDVRCGLASLRAKNGILQVDSLIFDTDNVLITGQGNVDLQKEEYDLLIRGHPKKLRLTRVRAPVEINGWLLAPSVSLEEGKGMLVQAGVAVALGALFTPIAAAVAFVDPGLAKDANCSALLETAKEQGAPVKTAGVDNAPRR